MLKKIIPIFLLVALSVASWTLFQKKNPKTYSKLNLAVTYKVKSFDPAVAFDDDSLFIMGQSLETLFQYHYLKRPFELIPLLAAQMPEVSEDGKLYTIKIKKGIFYQNHQGYFKRPREVYADDFIWQIKRLAFKPLKSTGAWLFAGKLKGFDEFQEKVGNNFNKFIETSISGLKAIDNYTLQIELNRPEPNLLYFLSMTFTTPVPVELINKFKNDFSDKMVGTGPYQYEGFDGKNYLLKRNENYHPQFYPTKGDRYANTKNLLDSSKKQLPFIDEVNFRLMPDEDEKWNDFLAGKIDILNAPKKFTTELSIDTSPANKILATKGVEIKHFSRQTSRWIGFNMNDPIVGKSLNLRRAIAHAIDYDRYIELLTNNTNLKSNSIFNPSIPGYDPSHRLSYSYDMKKAKKYFARALDELGLKKGELELTYTTRGKLQNHVEEAAFIQQSLRSLGIKVRVNEIDFPEFLKLGRAGKLQIWTDNWIYDYPDAENILQLLISKNHPGINKSGYSNEKVDELYHKLSQTRDKQKRYEIMYEIEKIVEYDLPWLMTMYESTYLLQHKNIKNFRKSFFIRNYVKYLQKQ